MATSATQRGPKGHFLSGNLPELRKNPLGFLTRCAREYGDFVPLRFGAMKAFLLSNPDYIEQVLVVQHRNLRKNRALERSRFLLGNGLLTSEGESWRRQRRLAQPAFHKDRIASYGDTMVEFTRRNVARWQDGDTRDIHAEMMRITLEIVAKTLFDADVSGETSTVAEAMKVALEGFNRRSFRWFVLPDQIPTPANLRLRRAVRQLDEIIYGIIQERRVEGDGRGDLLSMLLRATDDDGSGMSDKQLRDEVMTIFLAGHETTTIALSWIFCLLSQRPEVEERLVEELRNVLADRPPSVADLPRLRYTESVISESLRLYPPAWTLGRQATRGTTIGGRHVPRGALVLMSQWVMHRDPRYFDRPLEFEPERWANDLEKRLSRFAYFPFGGGPRHCIGSSFALTEVALLLATIAQSYHLELLPTQLVVPQPSITLRPRYGITMTLHRRR